MSPVTGNKITLNEQEHEINSDGLTGFFVDKPAGNMNITLNPAGYEAAIVNINPGDVQSSRITLNENITIQYEAATGGTVSRASETLPSIIGAAQGSIATVNAEYSFANWTKDGVSVSSETHFIPAKADGLNVAAAYTANFKAKTYTVAFNANGGGTTSTANKDVTYDSTYGELPTVTREDYKFKGWFTAASEGTEITAATTVKITADQTLYAQWEKKPAITVTANDASKTYDGTELTNNGWAYTGELATGDSLVVTIAGTRTDAGTAPNEVTFVKVMQGITDVTVNYEITYIAGTLVINSSSDGGESSATSQPTRKSVDILINGKTETAATATTNREGGKTVTTVVVDDKKVEERLEQEGSNAVVTIPVLSGADVVIGTLNGQTVKNMENKDAVLEVKTGQVTYTLPAFQINIDAVSEQIGEDVKLKDIVVSVKISEPAADTVRIVEDTANENDYLIVAESVEFEITCSRGDKTVEVSKFSAYVEILVAIPEGIDPSKITTGIIVNADGTFSHVPTVRALGLMRSGTGKDVFNDVPKDDWYYDAVSIAYENDIISGYGSGQFGPMDKITREQVMTMIARAMKITKPDVELTDSEVAKVLALILTHSYL